MFLKLSEKVHFLRLYADFSKKPETFKAIYIMHPKIFITLIVKMIWFIGV